MSTVAEKPEVKTEVPVKKVHPKAEFPSYLGMTVLWHAHADSKQRGEVCVVIDEASPPNGPIVVQAIRNGVNAIHTNCYHVDHTEHLKRPNMKVDAGGWSYPVGQLRPDEVEELRTLLVKQPPFTGGSKK